MRTAIAYSALLISTTATALPVLPRQMNSNTTGNAYSIISYDNGTYAYEGQSFFSWDLDTNSAYFYHKSYVTHDFEETSFCNGNLIQYTSTSKTCSVQGRIEDVESDLKNYIAEFNVAMPNYPDPIWGESSYQVIGHKSEQSYLYITPDTQIITFIMMQMSPDLGFAYVIYFPQGLRPDNGTIPTDFALKHSTCPPKAFLEIPVRDNGNMDQFRKHIQSLRPLSKGEKDALTQDVNQAFDLIDTDHDGYITPQEIKQAGEASGDTVSEVELKYIMFLVDTDRDGRISWEEGYMFGQLIAEELVENFSLFTRRDQINQIFALYDKNYNGQMEVQEFRQLLEKVYGYATKSDSATFIERIDKNSDGKVSWMEFYKSAY